MFVFLLWIKEASIGLVRNFWWNSVAFLMSLVCLMAFSFAFVAGDTAEHFSTKLHQRMEIQVDIKEDQKNYSEMRKQLLEDNRVSEISFISKTDAEKRMIKEMGEDATVLEIFDGENIFPAQFIVKVDQVDSIESVAKNIEKLGFSDRVLYGKEYIDTLLTVTSKIKSVGYYITIGGAIFVVFLVMWVIKMNIEQRKEEINIKQLIGSGFFTIRMPFMIEAILLMAASSLASYYIFSNVYEQFVNYVNKELPITSLALIDVNVVQNNLMVPLFGLALLLGFFGSVVATNKHLKRN